MRDKLKSNNENMKKSSITNCFVKCRESDPTLFTQCSTDPEAFYVNLDGYLIIPLETPLLEIDKILTQYRISQEQEEQER